MPEMVEAVKNEDNAMSVLFGYVGSATGVTSLTHLRARSKLALIRSYNFIPST